MDDNIENITQIIDNSHTEPVDNIFEKIINIQNTNQSDISDDCISYKIINNNDNKQIFCDYKISTKWAPDDSTDKCTICKKKFSYILKKHHCRLCGDIFCWECTDYKQVIPIELMPDDSKKTTWNDYWYSSYDEKRVCANCDNLIIKIKKVNKIVSAFDYINLDILELHKAATKCDLWKDSVEISLLTFKNIQRKLSFMSYTELEKRILWRNAQYFGDHSKYIMALIKICETENELNIIKNIINNNTNNKISHNDLMCHKSCSSKLSSIDVINLLVHLYKNPYRLDSCVEFILEYLKCSDEEYICYIPVLVYNIKFDSSNILINELISKCTNNIKLMNALYMELNNYIDNTNNNYTLYNIAHEKLIKKISEYEYKGIYEKILEGKSFIDVIKKIGKAICDDKKEYNEIAGGFKLTKPLLYPLDCNKKIKRIIINDIKFKDSATKPIIIPCEMEDGEYTKLMYKKENLRQDQIIMNMINLINIIIEKELNINLNLVTYNIIPISKTNGIIEIIDNAETLYYIKLKLHNTIQNYMTEKNGDMTINEFRERYIKSVAAYSVITYVFGIGDRHLDNIMVTRDGRLFHIDFGFILGKDPVFNNPGIRITPDMLEALGGLDSDYYIKFKDLATKIFNIIRKHIDIFINMLLLLKNITGNIFNEKEIIEHIIQRCVPSESDINANFHLVKKLETHSVTDRIKDFCHLHNKEKTISTTMNRFSNAVSGLANFFEKFKRN